MAPNALANPVQGTYQHFKGAFYEVLGSAEDPDTGNQYVVYRALGLMENLLGPDPDNHFFPGARVVSTPNQGVLAVSAVERFTELVDGKEYHKGERVPRFRLVSPAPRG